MLIASADSAAVVAKIVIATCSLMSEEGGYQKFCKRSGIPTEWTRIEKSPEGGIRSLKAREGVAGTWHDSLQSNTEDIGDDLKEQLADIDSLGTEVLS